jgi:hypothetical protein
MFKVEKHCIRFYKYKFLGYEDKPIVIEAYNKYEARKKLTYFLQQYPQFQSTPVVSESLSLPIFGETTKMINSVEHVFIGQPNNWMPLDEFINKDIW